MDEKQTFGTSLCPRACRKTSAVKMATYSTELISFCTLPSLACLEHSSSLPRLLSVALHHSPFTSSTHLILPHLLTLSHTILLAETDSSCLFPRHWQPGVLCCQLNSVGYHMHRHTHARIHSITHSLTQIHTYCYAWTTDY